MLAKSTHRLIATETQLFFIAVTFLTRLPVKISGTFQPEMLTQANRYFGVVGLLIGALNALFIYLLISILPLPVAVLLSMAFSLMLTGAFHEDGLADVFDGFGGGWKVEDKLTIMKDSRVGTYGASSLVIVLLIKYQVLVQLAEPALIVSGLVVAHCLSRVLATSLIFSMTYVQEDATSKVKPVALSLSTNSLQLLLLTGLFALSLLWGFTQFTLMDIATLTAILLVTRQLLQYWFNQQLGGYTGDCLGAAQQISELMVYLAMLIIINNGLAS